MPEKLPEMIVTWEPQYLPYIYSSSDRDDIIVSLVRQLTYYWKKGTAYGCISPENFTIIQKDHRLFAKLNKNAMDRDPEYDDPDIDKTAASDIFSLGLIWHALFAEDLPYWKGNADYAWQAVRQGERLDVFDYLDDLHYNLISRMLEPNPDDRITPEELLASIAAKRASVAYRRPQDGTSWVNVTVTGPDGKPMADALVDIYSIKSDESFYGHTDSSGKAELTVEAGECWLNIFRLDYVSKDIRFMIYAEDTMSFEIQMEQEEYEEFSHVIDEDIPF